MDEPIRRKTENSFRETNMVNLSAVPPSGFLSNYISANHSLAKKVKYIVINGTKSNFSLRVYRDSSDLPGYLSCENYQYVNFKQIGRVKKDKIKYEDNPIPKKAINYNILGNQIYSMTNLSKQSVANIENILKTKKIIS